MGIERSQLSDSTEQARKADSSNRAEREPPSRENVDRFRQAMQSRQGAAEEFAGARSKGAGELSQQQRNEAQAAARQAATADAVDAGRQAADDADSMPQMKTDPAELMAMMQAQGALRDGAHMAQAPAPAPANPAAFTELIERHVRQLAVGGGDIDERDGQVLLRMADATLPGTDLMLSKTADGWLLRADVRSRDSYDAIQDAAPELAKRFAERNLGILEISSEFHA